MNKQVLRILEIYKSKALTHYNNAKFCEKARIIIIHSRIKSKRETEKCEIVSGGDMCTCHQPRDLGRDAHASPQ